MLKVLTAPEWAQYLLLIPMGIVLLVAAVTDWRARKIYNWLTYPALLAAPFLNALAFGWSGLLVGLVTAFVVLLIGILMLPLGWLGGGDIKLLAAIGALLGPGPLFHIFFYSLILGLVMGLSLSLVNGYLIILLKKFAFFIKTLFISVATKTNLTQKMETDDRAYLPFAIPIFGAFIFACTDIYFGWPLFMDWMRESMAGLRLRG